MSQNEHEPHPLTTAEVAQILGKKARTVHRMAADGRLKPAMKLPGRTGAFLFDPEVVEAAKRQRSNELAVAS